MDERYLRLKNKLSAIVSEAKDIVDNESPKGFENKQAYRITNQIYDEIDTLLDRLEYLSKPAIEGKLRKMENDKFELIDGTGKYIASFSCGSRIEVYDSESKEWHPGRVEHKMQSDAQGYYFYNSSMEHPFLYTGMKARIRRNY